MRFLSATELPLLLWVYRFLPPASAAPRGEAALKTPFGAASGASACSVAAGTHGCFWRGAGSPRRSGAGCPSRRRRYGRAMPRRSSGPGPRSAVLLGQDGDMEREP